MLQQTDRKIEPSPDCMNLYFQNCPGLDLQQTEFVKFH